MSSTAHGNTATTGKQVALLGIVIKLVSSLLFAGDKGKTKRVGNVCTAPSGFRKRISWVNSSPRKWCFRHYFAKKIEFRYWQWWNKNVNENAITFSSSAINNKFNKQNVHTSAANGAIAYNSGLLYFSFLSLNPRRAFTTYEQQMIHDT